MSKRFSAGRAERFNGFCVCAVQDPIAPSVFPDTKFSNEESHVAIIKCDTLEEATNLADRLNDAI